MSEKKETVHLGAEWKEEKKTHKDDELTLEQFKMALPKMNKHSVTQPIVDRVNEIMSSPERFEAYKENVLMFTNVLTEGKFRLDSYVDAVHYVTCKLMGHSNMQAWCATFPDRYQHYLDSEYDKKHIASVVSIYNKGILVNKIYEQTLIPTHIINAGVYQKAINHLAHLMVNAKSEFVQSNSAAKLVDVLKLPETTKIELDIGLKETSAIEELRESTMQLVKQQRLMIEAGASSVKDVAHSRIVREAIDVEVKEVE